MRRTAPRRARPPPGLRGEDGEALHTEADIQARWLRYYTDLFNGSNATLEQLQAVHDAGTHISDIGYVQLDHLADRIVEAAQSLEPERAARWWEAAELCHLPPPTRPWPAWSPGCHGAGPSAQTAFRPRPCASSARLGSGFGATWRGPP